MCTHRITFIAVIAAFIIAAAAVVIGAELPQASISPDQILKGNTQTITITLDKSIPNQKEITNEITKVRVAGKETTNMQKQTEVGKLSVLLPKLDIVGRVDVEVIGKDDKTVAVGQADLRRVCGEIPKGTLASPSIRTPHRTAAFFFHLLRHPKELRGAVKSSRQTAG
jgi:hypothetical protein